MMRVQVVNVRPAEDTGPSRRATRFCRRVAVVGATVHNKSWGARSTGKRRGVMISTACIRMRAAGGARPRARGGGGGADCRPPF